MKNDVTLMSKPVYPQRVMRHPSTPATFATVVCMKYSSANDVVVNFCNADTAVGPWTAINDRSSESRNSTETSLPWLRKRSYSKQSTPTWNEKGKKDQPQKINSKSMLVAAVRELQRMCMCQCHALNLPHSIE